MIVATGDRIGDREELVVALNRDVFIVRILDRELERHHRHVQREHRHPAGRIRLLQGVARRQRFRAVVDGNVIEAEEAALEQVVALLVLAVDPPGIVQQQLVKHALEEREVRPAGLHALRAEHLQRAGRVHRRVSVAEVPFVGRDLAVRIEIALVQHQLDLVFRELDIDQRQRDAVIREVPRGEPRVLPAVRHRDDVGGLDVPPAGVAATTPLGRRRRGVARQPALHIVMVELLRPDHSAERLAHDAMIFRGGGRQQLVVEHVGLGAAGRVDRAVPVERPIEFPCRQHELQEK